MHLSKVSVYNVQQQVRVKVHFIHKTASKLCVFEVMVCAKVCVGCLFSLVCCYCGMFLQFTYIR